MTETVTLRMKSKNLGGIFWRMCNVTSICADGVLLDVWGSGRDNYLEVVNGTVRHHGCPCLAAIQ